MSDFFDDRRVIVACVIGIVIVLTISVTSIVFIWKNNLGLGNNNNGNSIDIGNIENSDLGKYKVVNASVEDQLRVYTNDLITMIQSSDIDKIYEKLDPGYIEYYNVTQSSLEDNLKGKMILGKKLEMSKYKSTEFNGKKVYAVEYSTLDNYINGKINLIEESPNQYVIAFDDFVSYDKEPRTSIQDGLSFTITEQVVFNSRYIAKIKFKNLNESSYVYNAKGLYENNFLLLNGGSEVRTLSSVVSGDSITLEKNSELNYTLEFNISDLSFSTFEGILIKDIKSNASNITKDYTFKI